MRLAAFLLVLCLAFPSVAASTTEATGVPVNDAIELSAEATEVIEGSANSIVTDPYAVPAELVDPAIPELELDHRLVPLTREELARLADAWLALVRVRTEEVMQAEIAIDRTEGEVKEEVRTALARMVFERNIMFDRFSQVLASWERKAAGAEDDLARIAEYRAYRDAVVLDELRTSEFQTLYEEGLHWLTDRDGGVRMALTALLVLAAMVALVILARFVRSVSRKGFARIDGLSLVLQDFLAAAVFWLVLASGLIVAFSLIGFDITPLFALIGAASFILAFAFQDTLGNIASGIMIMINRPFDVGDTVDLDGVTGVVESFSIIATRIVTFDNQVIVIPNRNVWGNIIRNMTATSTRRVDLVFGIAYRDSIEEAQALLEELVRAHPAVLEDPAPVIRVHELGESSVNFICRPWVRTEDYWTVHWDLTAQVKEAFDKRGISIPFPQRDFHLHVTKAGDGALIGASE